MWLCPWWYYSDNTSIYMCIVSSMFQLCLYIKNYLYGHISVTQTHWLESYATNSITDSFNVHCYIHVFFLHTLLPFLFLYWKHIHYYRMALLGKRGSTSNDWWNTGQLMVAEPKKVKMYTNCRIWLYDTYKDW